MSYAKEGLAGQSVSYQKEGLASDSRCHIQRRIGRA